MRTPSSAFLEYYIGQKGDGVVGVSLDPLLSV